MKPVLLSWAMSAVIAICIAPRFGDLIARRPVPHPAMLAQSDDSASVPGSEDSSEPNATDDENNQSGETATQPDESDPPQEPPAEIGHSPTDENGNETSAAPDNSDDPSTQQPNDNGDEGMTPPASSSDSDNN